MPDDCEVIALFEVRLLPDASAEALENYARYKASVAPLVDRYGGTYLIRAAFGEALEGERESLTDLRWHVLRFPSAEAARAFWASPAYAEISPLRQGAVEVRAVLLQPPPDTTTATSAG